MTRHPAPAAFERSASFYFDRAERLQHLGDALGAVDSLYRAVALQPGDSRYLMALGVQLMKMERYAQSAAVFAYPLAYTRDVNCEIYLGLACDLMAMGEVTAAESCMKQYLTLRTETYSPYTEAFSKVLQQFRPDASAKPQRMSMKAVEALRVLRSGQAREAALLMENLSVGERLAPDEHAGYLSSAYFLSGQYMEGIACAQAALEHFPKSLTLWCNLAMCAMRTGDTALAEHALAQACALPTADDAEENKLTLMLCELGRFREALLRVRDLRRKHPYGVTWMHAEAACLYGLGQFEAARKLWVQMARLDPEDILSPYFARCAFLRAQGEPSLREVPFNGQLPQEAVRERIDRAAALMRQAKDTPLPRHEQEELEHTLLWGLGFHDSLVRHSVIDIIAQGDRSWSEPLLRRYLLRVENEEVHQRHAVMALKRLGAQEPYVILQHGGLAEARVQPSEAAQDRSRKQLEVLREAVRYLKTFFPDQKQLAEDAARLWQSCMQAHEGLEALNEVSSWAAALALCYCRVFDEGPDLVRIAEDFSMRPEALERMTRYLMKKHQE